MKIQSFKDQLRGEVTQICNENGWEYNNNALRGKAFEIWCFQFFAEMYADSDNRLNDCWLQQDDFNIDVVFQSREFQEVFFIQAKYEKPAQNEAIPYPEVETFFSSYEYLYGHKHFSFQDHKNQRINQLSNEVEGWKEDGFKAHFIFISTGKITDDVEQRTNSFAAKYGAENVEFEVWDISKLRDEWVRANSLEEHYPDEIKIQLGTGRFLNVDGPENHLTFVIPGTKLNEIFTRHQKSLFNWNIRKFLGRGGRINSSITDTIINAPDTFYYLNNGISALCDDFSFNESTRELNIKKLQIVNGAQTIGAIGHINVRDNASALSKTQVLVKLTAVKKASNEKGLAAAVIRANNTQNTLRVPDFRSNDQIQLWIENQFANAKPRGQLGKILYGRKRPYPRPKTGHSVLKMLDFAKIRYAWEHQPRLVISSPNKLFIHKEHGGVYEDAFGIDGKIMDVWSEAEFNEALLAIHTHNFCQTKIELMEADTFEFMIDGTNTTQSYGQLSRLKFYGLKCMRSFADEYLDVLDDTARKDLYSFRNKFDDFCTKAIRPVESALKRTYEDIIKNREGAAFSLPRDGGIWNEIKANFDRDCRLIYGQQR